MKTTIVLTLVMILGSLHAAQVEPSEKEKPQVIIIDDKFWTKQDEMDWAGRMPQYKPRFEYTLPDEAEE